MKRIFILSAIATASLTAPATGSAAINNPDALGYFQRGVAMYNDKNYDGCIDQLLQMRNLDPSAAEREDALYYIAMATLHCGDDEAIDFLRSFLIEYPQSPRTQDVSMTIGDYYFTRALYGDAIVAYRSVNSDGLTADRREDLKYRMAYSQMLIGETKSAEVLFDQLLSTKHYGNAARFYKGYIAYHSRNYAEARRQLEMVDTSREPGQAAAYYLCQINFIDGKYSQAYNQASKLLANPTVGEYTPELQRIAGESLYNLGRTFEALPYLRNYAATAEDPRPSALYILGVSEYDGGNYDRAIDMLQKATAEDSATGQAAYLYLGKAYTATGNNNAAIMAFDKASSMPYDEKISETAAYDYIAARMDGGRVPFGNSVAMLENFLERYPNSAYASKVSESLVTGYMSESDFDNALRIINQLKNPSAEMLKAKQRILLQLGVRQYSAGNAEKALEYFDEGAAMTQGAADITRQCRLWSANCRYDIENYAEAAADYLTYLESAPSGDSNRTSAYYNLAYTRLRQERYADAYKDFMRVADSKAPDARTRADALNRAADCLYCQRKFKEAAALYDKAFQTYPQAGDYALFQQAEMAGYARDYNTRIRLLDQMIDRFPSSSLVADALMAKAESQTVTDRHADAIKTYTEVIDAYPATSQGRRAMLMLAVNRLESGDREGAMDDYQRVVTTYPTSQEARMALDDLKNLYAADGRLPDYVVFVNSVADAPKVEISQFETTAFDNAERQFLADQSTDRLKDYVSQFPNGTNLPQALLYLAEDASDSGNLDDAQAYASELISRFPDSEEAEEALLIKADNEAAQGKGELALESYRRLSQRASTPAMQTAARMGILMNAVDLGLYDDILQSSEQLLASSLTNAEYGQIKLYRAIALDKTGRTDEACSLWGELAKDPSTIYGSKSAVYMIEALTRSNRLDDAEKMANEFIDAGSPHDYWYARGFIAYSDILRLRGKDFEADEYLKALRTNYPADDADIYEMIDTRLKLQ